jgi:hypothetical protein
MKCAKCGLMQRSQERCKRCGNPLDSRSPAAPAAAENPYAPPVTVRGGAGLAGAPGEMFRDGQLLVARDGSHFPDRCVQCNESAEGFRLKKTFYWHSPSWYALILLNLLIYAIVAMVVRKKASFELALCARHRSRRQWCIAIGFGLPIVSFILMMASEANVTGLWIFLLALFAGALVGIYGAQVLTPKKIDDGFAYLKGAHPQFLASLPALR